MNAADGRELARFDARLPGWQPGPLDVEPVSVYPPYTKRRGPWVFDTRTDRLDALAHALAGVDLGNYDLRILDWLAVWDNATVATVVSLIHRARHAAVAKTTGGAR
jgi:hypothetical protein